MNRHERRKIMASRPKRPMRQREGVMCHEDIKKIAENIAGEYYTIAARDDNFFHQWPNENEYIEVCWPDHVGAARESLTKMLTMSKYTEDQKEQIYHILCLDRTLPKSQSRGIH